nr:hypothetical protein [Tanacetum cinerariifolium]
MGEFLLMLIEVGQDEQARPVPCYRPMPFRVFGSVMRNSTLSRSWPISVLSVWFKSQGPDAVKKFCDLFKNAFFVCIYINPFESTGRLAKGCNPSLISLVPEKKDPVELTFSVYICQRQWWSSKDLTMSIRDVTIQKA